MVYLRKSASYILPIAFAFYSILMFPLLKEIIFSYDSFYNVWRARKIVEDPLSLLRPDFMGRFGPLYTLFFFLMDRFFEFNPLVYGGVNGSLHLLNTFLLFRLSRRLIAPSEAPAILTSLVFLFSSTQWGVFADTSQTMRLVCAALVLSSLLFFMKWMTSEKKRDWVLSLIFFIGTFGFIEDAVTLPLLLLVILFLIPPRRIPWSEKLIGISPFFFVSLIVVFLSFSVKAPEGWGLTMGPHMAMNFVFLIRELVQFLLIPRSEFVPLSGIPGVFLRLLPLLLIFSFSGIVWYWRKDQIPNALLLPSVGRILIFGIAWIGITSLLYVLRPMQGAWQGRYLYIPAMGEAMVVGILLYQVGRFLKASSHGVSVAKLGVAGVVLYGLVLNISTTFLMVNKAREGVRAALQEEIPVVFSMVSILREKYGAPLEMPPHMVLWVEGLPFTTSRLRELLPTYYISAPSMIIEAKEGRPLKDFSREENQRILYMKWENQTFSSVPIGGQTQK